MSKRLWYVFAISLVVLLAIGFYFRLAQQRTELLYEQAFAPGSTREVSRSAIEKLARDGPHGRKLLLDAAMGRTATFSFASQPQIEAVRALRSSSDPTVANELASLLQPHNSLDLKMAVAQTLQDLPCSRACIESVLHYLERIWHGDLNTEDEMIPQLGMTFSSKAEHDKLFKDLYSVLTREGRETLSALERIYGLGSENPALFALDLLNHVQIAGACDPLHNSLLGMDRLPKGLFKSPRAQVDSALSAMNCK